MAMQVAFAEFDHPRARDWYRVGRYRSLWESLAHFGPPETWTDPDAIVIGGRLLTQFGADRRAGRLVLRAHRQHPEHLNIAEMVARQVLGRRGPMAVWSRWEALPHGADRSLQDQATWHAFAAEIHSFVRDETVARRHLAAARDLLPEVDEPWWAVIEARIAMGCDDRVEAEACYRRIIDREPNYRPAVQGLADLLLQDQRGADCEALLESTAERCESAGLWGQLAASLLVREADDAVEKALDRWHAELLFGETSDWAWEAGVRAEIYYRRGDLDGFRAAVAKSESTYLTEGCANLELGGDPSRRVTLPVPHVQQARLTCAPATLVAIARMWEVAADHDTVADAICYDGTPDWRERRWAEEAGFATAEFRVTWESAVDLLDKGIPFTLVTVASDSSHLQAVVGYDAGRRLFRIRDPGSPYVSMVLADSLLKHQAAHGPRGMALIPRARAAELAACDLPEVKSYDALHQVSLALHRHKREDAETAMHQLKASDSDGRLTALAQRCLASYDGDLAKLRDIDQAMHERYPDDWRWRLIALADLYDHVPRAELVQRHCEAARESSAPPAQLRTAIHMLRADPTKDKESTALRRRLVRLSPFDPSTMALEADIAWDENQRQDAVRWYRFASALDPVNEDRARNLFLALRPMGRVEEGLAHLRARAQRARRRSGAPTLSVLWALDLLGQGHLGDHDIAEQSQARSDDEAWFLGLARRAFESGDLVGGDAALDRARPLARAVDVVRIEARRGEQIGDSAAAIAAWAKVLAMAPWDHQALQHWSHLLRLHKGDKAAVAAIDEWSQRFPHNYRVSSHRVQVYRNVTHTNVGAVLDAHITAYPYDAWALRERGFFNLEKGDHASARRDAEAALAVEDIAVSRRLFADVHAAVGTLDEARSTYHRALEQDPDDAYALSGLIAACPHPQIATQEIIWFRDLMRRSVILGSAILSYRHHAGRILGRESCLTTIREAHAQRSDLWQCWSALIMGCLDFGHIDEARNIAKRAVEQFPRLPRLWVDYAYAERLGGDLPAARAAYEEALRLAPGWAEVVRSLAEQLELAGDLDGARAVVEQALRFQPDDGFLHGFLADYALRQQRREEGLTRLERAIDLAPEYEWAWNTLQTEDHKRMLAVARRHCALRPSDAAAWVRLAQRLPSEALDEQRKALDTACKIAPRNVEVRRQRMRLWHASGEPERIAAEISDACWAGSPPIVLRCDEVELAAERGDLIWAENHAKKLVSDFAGDSRGLFLLGRIQMARKHYTVAAKTFRELIALEPIMAVAYGWLGDAEQADGQLELARTAFSRAFALEPSYHYAGTALCEIEIAAKQPNAAAEALAVLEQQRNDEYIRLLRLRVELLRPEPATSNAVFSALVADAQASPALILRAMDAFVQARNKAVFSEMVEAAIATGPVHEQVWYRYAPNLIEKRKGKTLRLWLEQLPDHHFNPALGAVVEAMAEIQDGKRAIDLVLHFGERGRKGTLAWGAVGYVYNVLGKYSQVRDWMADWATRSDAKPWMLTNLSIALRNLNDFAGAAETMRCAEALPADHTETDVRRWIAIDTALADGNPDPVPREEAGMEGYERDIARLADAASLLPQARSHRSVADRALQKIARVRNRQGRSQQITSTLQRLERRFQPLASWWWTPRIWWWRVLDALNFRWS